MTQTTPTRDEAVLGPIPTIDTFAINPVGEGDICVEGSSRFSHERDVVKLMAWARKAEALLASAPAPASGGVDAVAVKALEWSEQGLSHSPTWRAESSFGRYLVYMKPDNSWAFEPPGRFGGKVGFKSPNDAMAAAQSEHDQNIRSALSPAATPVSEAEPVAGEPHYCKHCDRTFLIRVPRGYSGDALIECTGCGWQHPRQFEAGVAVSCEPPRGKPLRIKGARL